MVTKRFKKHLNEKEFIQGKKLLEVGLRLRQVGEVLGRSYGTVANVKKAKNWADYQRNGKEAYEKRFGKKVSKDNGHIRALLLTIIETVDAIEAGL